MPKLPARALISHSPHARLTRRGAVATAARAVPTAVEMVVHLRTWAEESLGAPLDLAHADFTEEHATSCDGMDSAVQYINREDKRWQHSARLLMGRQYVPN